MGGAVAVPSVATLVHMSGSLSTGVGVLDKAMAIVDLCEDKPQTASEIARTLDMTVSTAHRLAGALAAHGMLRREESGLYRLGPRFLTSRLTDLAQPILERLTKQFNETSQLWVLRGDDRVCAGSVVADTELRVVLPVGARLPLASGGSASFALRGQIGPDGWVESISKRTAGLGSVSAPVIVDGESVAALCVVAPMSRVPSTPGELFGKHVVRAAEEIARGLLD